MQEKLKYFFFSLLLLIIGCNKAQAQNKMVDSLKIVLQNKTLHDTIRLDILAGLIDYTFYLSPEARKYNQLSGELASLNLARKDLTLAERRIYLRYLANYYNNLGTSDNNLKSTAYLDKAISIYKYLRMYDELYSTITSKAGYYAAIGDNYNAIRYFYKALKYFEQRKDKGDLIYVLYQLGNVYHNLDDDHKAITYYEKVFVYLKDPLVMKEQHDDALLSTINGNMGTSYLQLKQFDKADFHFKKALEYAKKIPDPFSIGIILTKIGLVEQNHGKLDAALLLYREAQAFSVNEFSEANLQLRFGEVYYLMQKYEQAEQHLTKAYSLVKKIGNNRFLDMSSALLHKVYRANHKYQKSLEILEINNKIKDLNKVETAKNALVQQQLKYDYETKSLQYKLETEKQNAEKNTIMILLSSALFLLMIGVYFLYRNYKQKQTINTFEKNELNQRLLITQMNPHFIFNSIDNIQSLIYNKQDKEAVNYLTKFSKLTRQILENSNENYISLSEELTMIDNYLVIQQLLYNNSFDFDITVEDEIDPEIILLPPMLTQPFIENAIKHGIQNKTVRGMIVIRFSLKDTKLYFEIKDNGIGFGTSTKDENHKSLAMTITKERLVNYTKKSDFAVQTENVLDQYEKVIGAKVIFEIPYIYEN